MKHHLVTAVLVGTVVSGCAMGPMPQTGQEYRAGYGSGVETLDIDRTYQEVAKTLKAKSEQCLKVKLHKTKCRTQLSCPKYEVFYHPTFVSGKNKSELHVQWRRKPWDSTFLGGGKPPEDGIFIAAFDVEPAGKNKTKMTVYAPSQEELRTVPNAVEHWARGSNMGCPDLTKPYWY